MDIRWIVCRKDKNVTNEDRDLVKLIPSVVCMTVVGHWIQI